MKKHKVVSTFAIILSILLVGNTAFAIETEYQEESSTEETDTEEESSTEETDTEETDTEEETITERERTTEKETDTKEDTPEKKIEIKEMYRLYNPNNGEHFYTADINEKNHLVKVGWNYEGIAWNAPTEGNPVYRLYNPNAGDHFYTLDVNERNHLVDVGWNYEGIGWYSDSGNKVPVFRLYNPNAVTGTHHYTVNYFEVENLKSLGWNYEGIGWYSSDGTFVDAGNNGEKKEYMEIKNIQVKDGTFDVFIFLEGEQSKISKVYVPVWTKPNQSDIYWYAASKQADGSYKVTIDALKHQWNSGEYYVQCYVQSPQGDMQFVDESHISMQLEPKITVEKLGIYSTRIKIWGIDENVDVVKFPAWSLENNQDDVVWYEGQKQSDGSWYADVYSNNHKHAGDYVCHIYSIKDGVLTWIDAVEFRIEERGFNHTSIELPDMNASGINVFYDGGSISPEVLKTLEKATGAIVNKGYNLGYVMIDLSTGNMISYNAEKIFYSASTIKGPYVACLNQDIPSSRQKYASVMRETIKVSSNGDYATLRNVYGGSQFKKWLNDAGCGWVSSDENYTAITPKALSQMWMKMYAYFVSNQENSAWCADLYTYTKESFISNTLSGRYTVYSKAGWFSGSGYWKTQSDGGVIVKNGYPYVMVVLSNAYGQHTLLNTLANTLNNVHSELIK